MNTYAYDHNLPCLNTSCKSHGRPHPNCQCYGGRTDYAEGGQVEPYCSKDQAHKEDCMYYAGGMAPSIPFADGGNVDSPDFIPDENKPQDKEPDFISDKDFNQEPSQKDTSQYETTGQQALTAIEGGAQGFLGPIATGIEKGLNYAGVPGVSDEDISGRAEANPLIHGGAEAAGLGAGLLTGTGETGLITKGVSKIIPKGIGALAKLGSAALKGGIEAGLFQGGDEISNAMLGKGDPEAPVSSALAHMGAAALLGSATGGIFNSIGQAGTKGLQAIENSKMATKANNMILGLGIASRMKELGISGIDAEEYVNNMLGDSGIKPNDVKFGIKLFNKGADAAHSKITRGIADTLGTLAGGATGGIPGSIAGGVFTDQVIVPMVENIIDKGISKSNKYVMPAVLKAVSEGNTDGLFKSITYADKVTKGAAKIGNAIDGLFKVGGQQLINHEATDKDREKLHKFIEEGGVNQQIQNQLNSSNQQEEPQQYAKGGVVKHHIPKNPEVSQEPDHFATVFPEQSMLLSSAKSRVYNYLNSMRPQPPAGKLPYDKYTPNKEQQRSYDRALDIANEPLSIVNHIKNGSITPEHIKHMAQLYPELYKNLSKQITTRISENQLKDERPNYRIRQGLSLFLANPMESSFTPANIQAAQNVFVMKKQAAQQQGKTKRGTSTLGKDNKTYKTADQAAESDRSSRD